MLLISMFDVLSCIQTNPSLPWESFTQKWLIDNNFDTVDFMDCSDTLSKLRKILVYLLDNPSTNVKGIITKMLCLANQLNLFYNSNHVNSNDWHTLWNIFRSKGLEAMTQAKLKPLLSVFNKVLTEESLPAIFSDKGGFEHKFNSVFDYFKHTKNPLVDEGVKVWETSQSLNQTSNSQQNSSQSNTANFITTPAWISKFGSLITESFKFVLPPGGLERLKKAPQSESLFESFICTGQGWVENRSQLACNVENLLSSLLNTDFVFLPPTQQVCLSCPSGDKKIDVLLLGSSNNDWWPVVIEIWSLVIIKIIFCFKTKDDIFISPSFARRDAFLY